MPISVGSGELASCPFQWVVVN